MFNNTELPSISSQTNTENKDKPRKPYHKPQLEQLGDLRTLTLGGSPGQGDSGFPPIPEVSKPPGF